jgi:hypothetical protein
MTDEVDDLRNGTCGNSKLNLWSVDDDDLPLRFLTRCAPSIERLYRYLWQGTGAAAARLSASRLFIKLNSFSLR